MAWKGKLQLGVSVRRLTREGERVRRRVLGVKGGWMRSARWLWWGPMALSDTSLRAALGIRLSRLGIRLSRAGNARSSVRRRRCEPCACLQRVAGRSGMGAPSTQGWSFEGRDPAPHVGTASCPVPLDSFLPRRTILYQIRGSPLVLHFDPLGRFPYLLATLVGAAGG